MKRFLPSNLFLIFLAALILRIIWFFVVLMKNPSGFMLYDSWGYWKIAENLELHGVFSQTDTLIPDSVRTPVFPLFIFLLKKSFAGFYGIILAQILISSASCAISSFISERIFNNKKAGIAAGIFTAFDFPSIYFANTLLTETLFTFLVLLFFCFFIVYMKNRKNIYMFLSAVFTGIAILCRPVAVYLPVIFAAIIFFSPVQAVPNSKIKPAFIFLLTAYLTVTPWLFRNHQTFGSAFLSTIGEINLLMYTAAEIRAEKENKPLFQIQQEYKELSLKNYDWDNPSETVRFTEFCREEAFGIIKENPVLFLKNYTASVFYFFTKPLRNYINIQLGISKNHESFSELNKSISNTAIIALFLVFFQIIILIVSYLFFAASVFSQNKKTSLPIILILLLIFYFAVFSGITEVDARMRVPVVPFLSIIASNGILSFLTKNRNPKPQTNL